MRRVATSMFKFDLGHRHWAARYGCATLLVALALLLNSIPAARSLPFVFFFAAVAVSARTCGVGPALLATGLSAIAADYFFLPPRFAFARSAHEILQVL